MKMHAMKIIFFLTAVLIALGLIFGHAQCAHAKAVTGEFVVTSDNEGNSTTLALAGYKDWFGKWSLEVDQGLYTTRSTDASRTFNESLVKYYRGYNDKVFLWGNAGELYGHGVSYFIGEFGGGWIIDPKWYVEWDLSRVSVDTFAPGTYNDIMGLGATCEVDYTATNQLTLTGMKKEGWYTDHNHYAGYEFRAIYKLKSVKGLDVQYWHRYNGFDFHTTYFAPQTWTRDLVGVEYKGRALTDWTIKTSAFTGPSTINNVPGTFSKVEIQAKKIFGKNNTLKTKITYATSTSAGYVYQWRYAGIDFEHRF